MSVGEVTIVGHNDVELLAPEWEDLAGRLGAAPWLYPGWFAAWWDAFGVGRLRVFSLRREGRLVGVLPLGEHRGRVSSLSNWHTPEYGLVAEPGAAEDLIRSVLQRRPRRMSLAFVPRTSAEMAAVRRAAADAGYNCLARPLERSPYVTIDGDWESYEAGLRGKLRNELGRRRRRLADEGTFSFHVADGRERLDGLLDEGFRVEAAGWKVANGSAILSKPATERFYRAVAHWAAERGWLQLGFLRLDGRMFAFDLCFECDGTHYLLKTGFDPLYRRFAPGMILRYEMLAHAFASGLRTYEFLGADEPWKLEWTMSVRERELFQAFARSAVGLIDWTANAYARPLIKRALVWR